MGMEESAVQQVQEQAVPAASPMFADDRYLVRRKIMKLVGGAFHVFDQTGRVVAYSEQKAFKLREDIRIYADETKSVEVLRVAARQIIDFSAAYDVFDSAGGAKIGALRRCGGRSILRDEWRVLDPAEREIGTIIEDSMTLALVRRMLTNLVPQRYDVFFPDATSGQKVGSLDQNFNPFVYKLDVDLSMDPQRRFDPRMAIASAILLAAVEGKQG